MIMPVSQPTPHSVDVSLQTRAVHLADRMGMEWGDFLFLLEAVERYVQRHDKGAPPPKAL